MFETNPKVGRGWRESWLLWASCSLGPPGGAPIYFYQITEPFIQQVLIEGLSCAWHAAQCWGHNGDPCRHRLCL